MTVQAEGTDPSVSTCLALGTPHPQAWAPQPSLSLYRPLKDGKGWGPRGGERLLWLEGSERVLGGGEF